MLSTSISYLLLLYKIKKIKNKNNFHWRQDQRILMTEDSLLLFACNDHEWFVREKDMTTSIENSYKNAIQISTKKKSPKKLKQKNIKWKLKLDWNCILKIVLHSTFDDIFFFKWFLKIVCGTTLICVEATTFCFKN